MKATGIVRKVDELGRVVLPIELRRTLGVEVGDKLEISVDGSSIVLMKYQQHCYLCSGTKALKLFKGKNICGSCIEECKNR